MSNKLEPLGRREVICGGGAITVGALAAWLMAGASLVRAEALAQGAPEIDRLTLSTVIDSYQIAVAPDVKVANVTIKRFGFALSDEPPGKAIASEFGLSLHASSQAGSETRNILIDLAIPLRRSIITSLCLPSIPARSTRLSSRTAITTISAGSSVFSVKTRES
jgi:hypothetical protein